MIMPIRTPHWAPAGSYPTNKGWVSASGEVLKKQAFTAEQIAEWHSNHASPKQTLHEAPVVEKTLSTEAEQYYYEEFDS